MLIQEKMEIDVEDAHILLQWWGLADTFVGQELAIQLEDFILQSKTKEEP